MAASVGDMSDPVSPPHDRIGRAGPRAADSLLARCGLPDATARVAVGLVSLLVLAALVSLERAHTLLISARDAVVAHGDTIFVVAANLSLAVLAVIALHPIGRRRLGAEDERPEFGRATWLAMLFSAGLASGLLYWATAEPILHARANPWLGPAPAPDEAARHGMRITMLHWGIHGWGLYVLAALAIAIPVYRRGAPLRFRAVLDAAGGARSQRGGFGATIDLLAIFGTICGVATSIGLSAGSMHATLAALFGTGGGIGPDGALDVGQQVVIIGFVALLGIGSALSGLSRGIRWLSAVNAWVSVGLMTAFLVLGPTREILSLVGATLVDYGRAAPALGLWVGTTPSELAWQAEWTIFYWAWWLAWTPFVALFVVRISRGRTIREFVLGVTILPTLVTLVWMGIFGGTALLQERALPGAVSRAVEADPALGLVAVIRTLGGETVTTGLIAVACFLLFTWLITSLDSATLVLCELLGVGDVPTAKVFWGLAVAAVAAILLVVGGLTALQAASIVVGLPLAFVQIAAALGLLWSVFRRRI